MSHHAYNKGHNHGYLTTPDPRTISRVPIFEGIPLQMNWIMHLHSRGSLVGEEVLRDPDLSDDEDLIPDQPSFVHLFRPQLF